MNGCRAMITRSPGEYVDMMLRRVSGEVMLPRGTGKECMQRSGLSAVVSV